MLDGSPATPTSMYVVLSITQGCPMVTFAYLRLHERKAVYRKQKKTYLHCICRHTDPFEFCLLDHIARSASSGGAHCSSRPSSHASPTGLHGVHALPLSGQKLPAAHNGGTVSVGVYPNANSSRLHCRGMQVPLVPAEQKYLDPHSVMNFCVEGSMWSLFPMHSAPSSRLPDLTTQKKVGIKRARGSRERMMGVH